MADLMDVRHIYLDWRGICHVVAKEQSGWVHTLCGNLETGTSTTTWPVKRRICRKCRKRLKESTVVRQGEERELSEAVAQFNRTCERLPWKKAK